MDAQDVLLQIEDLLCNKKPCGAKTMATRHKQCIWMIERYANEKVAKLQSDIRGLLGCYEEPEEYD